MPRVRGLVLIYDNLSRFVDLFLSFSPLKYCANFTGSPLIAVLIFVREFKKHMGKIASEV